MTIEGHAIAMKAPIRATAYHGCGGSCQQGRRPCDCSLGVAPIKSSTPRFSELPITMEESPPLANPWFWVGLACSAGIWAVIWFFLPPVIRWIRTTF